jgi:hypothetical protein
MGVRLRQVELSQSGLGHNLPHGSALVEELATAGRCRGAIFFVSLDDVGPSAPAMHFVWSVD